MEVIFQTNPPWKTTVGIVSPEIEKATIQLYQEKFWLFRELEPHLHGNDKLEKLTWETFIFFSQTAR